MRIKKEIKPTHGVCISKFTPKLFWKTCTACGDRLKKESMWHLYVTSYGHEICSLDLCMGCYPDLSKVIERGKWWVDRSASEWEPARILLFIEGREESLT